MKEEIEPISEVVLEQQGSFKRVRQWYAGHHKDLGVFTSGWQGEPQTVRDIDVISPVATVIVYEGSAKPSK